MKEEFAISPIGYVHVTEDGFSLELEQEYLPALKGLDTFSHINVLWWSHLVDSPEERAILEAEQPYKNAPSKLGIFATRSPLRPNPIALSVAPILGLDYTRGIIYLPYLDAEDGTPVIDIKPYHPSTDRVKDLSVPDWCSHWPKWYEESGSFDWAAEFLNAR